LKSFWRDQHDDIVPVLYRPHTVSCGMR
jgi:hypothetical protein